MKLILFLFSILFVTAAYAQDFTEVLEQVAPASYPAAAMAVRATGEVGVQITINSDGDVTSASAVRGHPLLRAISESAARGWKFIKLPAASPERTKTLIFNFQPGEIVFIDESESADSVKIRKTFTSTYSAEVFSDYLIPRLLLLPREKGNIKPESCELHHELEEVEIVNFSCEHRNNTAIAFERSSEYNDAEDELFPNASPEDMLGCSANGIERKEIHYCASCRIARNNWLQINRK